jgi:hypothetical protein
MERWTFRKGHEKVKNVDGQGRCTVRDVARSGTLDGQGRCKVRDVGRSGTLDGLKRSWTTVPKVWKITFAKSRSRSRFKIERSTVMITVIISFLKRECDRKKFRTVDHIQYELFRPFTVPDRFWTFHDVFLRWWTFFIVYIYYSNTDRTSWNGRERWTAWNVHTVQDKLSWNVQERLGTLRNVPENGQNT